MVGQSRSLVSWGVMPTTVAAGSPQRPRTHPDTQATSLTPSCMVAPRRFAFLGPQMANIGKATIGHRTTKQIQCMVDHLRPRVSDTVKLESINALPMWVMAALGLDFVRSTQVSPTYGYRIPISKVKSFQRRVVNKSMCSSRRGEAHSNACLASRSMCADAHCSARVVNRFMRPSRSKAMRIVTPVTPGQCAFRADAMHIAMSCGRKDSTFTEPQPPVRIRITTPHFTVTSEMLLRFASTMLGDEMLNTLSTATTLATKVWLGSTRAGTTHTVVLLAD